LIAGDEAQQLVEKNNFGEHANFATWKDKNSNKYFTELAIEANTEGHLPPKKLFAKVN